jgi:hypothetical protein
VKILLFALVLLAASYLLISYKIIQNSFLHDNLKNDAVFNSIAWKKGNPREKGQMVNDLIENHKFYGLTKKELVELLGSPRDSVTYRLYPEGPERYSYVVDKGHAYIYDFNIFFDTLGLVDDVLFDD